MSDSIWVDLLGSEVRYYDAGGIRTRCIEAGDGEPVIMLHGVGGHAEAYARNVVPLAQDFRAVALDYLGFGLTGSRPGPLTHHDYVAHLIDFMDAAGIESAHLVGESLGGWVSFWTALEHPDRVKKLVSVCGARLEVETDPESDRHVSEGLDRLRTLTKAFAADPSRENMRRRLDWLFFDPARDVTEELVDVRWTLYQRTEADRARGEAATAQIATPHEDADGLTPDLLGQIKHPTLVLWTDHNPSTTAATARRAAEYLPASRFHLMESCAHWPQWEDPQQFNSVVAEFLAE